MGSRNVSLAAEVGKERGEKGLRARGGFAGGKLLRLGEGCRLLGQEAPVSCGMEKGRKEEEGVALLWCRLLFLGADAGGIPT